VPASQAKTPTTAGPKGLFVKEKDALTLWTID
jgi:hypothetical protein